MGYSAADERFSHQWPRPFDEVHHPDGSWSDRCYFYAHSPDGSLLITNGYGNNPNQRSAVGHGKVTRADGAHWDPLAGQRVTGADRDDLHAGPMRWTCVEPLRHWLLELGPNASGIEWELHYTPRAPMWELLPMHVVVDGRMIVDMFHMKESGVWTGWVQIDGERISVDGSVQYVDGGFTHVDGTLSKRFVQIDHDIAFADDRKRPARATLVFTDEDGQTYRVEADAPHQHVNAYYGQPLPKLGFENLGDGGYFVHFPWDSRDGDELVAVEARSMSIDQLMRFDLDGMIGHGIFEILSGGDGSPRYPNWPPMDMTPFRQRAAPPADE